jgi:DNA invertase Pin-like site-specific DNA recombinase
MLWAKSHETKVTLVGKYPKLDQYRPEIEALLKNGSTQKFIANRYGTTDANLHNWLKKNLIKRNELQNQQI